MFQRLRQKLLSPRAVQCNERGLAAWKLGDLTQAEADFRLGLAADGQFAPLLSNLGALLMALNRFDEGYALLERAASLAPDNAGVLVNLGNACAMGGDLQRAIALFQAALQHEPQHAGAVRNVLRPLLETCDWNGLDQLMQRADLPDLLDPFTALFLPLSRLQLLQVAKREAASYAHIRPTALHRPQRAPMQGRRLRLGYLSSDFHDHPTMHLSRRLYGLHDRDRFEVHAYSIGYNDDSAVRRELVRSVDAFVDAQHMGARALAQRVADDGIDILIDLKGHTGGGRPDVLAWRPAPLQVNWLGFPGTMGPPFADVLVADATVLPEAHEDGYAERVLRMPVCYQVTDNQQPVQQGDVAMELASRQGARLVLACFNNASKIDRRTFALWLRVLQQVPDAVLWLLDYGPVVQQRLRQAAQGLGVDPARLVFCPIRPKAVHLHRLALADLMLDTLICNAHTTATDALWVDVPLITRAGETFASRVAASLLHACGLDELVATDDEAYVELAVSLARSPLALADVRRRLHQQKSAGLFNTERYVKDFEALLFHAVERH